MNSKMLYKNIKNRSKASNSYMFISVLSGIVTTFLSIWLVSLYMNDAASPLYTVMIITGICVLLLSKAIFYAVGIWNAHNAAYQSLTDIRLDIIDHLKQLPLSFFQKRKVGDLTNIISHDVEQIEVYLAHAQPEIAVTKIVAVLAAVGLFAIDWRLALALLLPFPFMVMFQKFTKKLWRNTFQRYADSTREMSEDLIEYISGMPAIKAFSTDEHKTEAILSRVHNYLNWIKKTMYTISIPMSLTRMFLEIGFVLVVVVGTLLMRDGQISVIQFVLAIVLSILFPNALISLMTFHHKEIVLGRSMENISSILDEELSLSPLYKDKVSSGNIEMQNVNFSYNGSDLVLRDINLTFEENTVTAIVGSSGSGKSTIANLIMGFWAASGGLITIGDNDINDLNEKNLSEMVSIVQQEVFLYNSTIEENIRIGRADASIDDIIEAAKKARIHDIINSLPDGYSTIVGEGGAKLSGGERQRIAIARIILKNAPIIILDEATASIDPYNEHLIQEAIGNLSENKTLIVIAHHLNTIVHADQIIVMDQGAIVARGTHKQLLNICPIYTEMVTAQNEVDHWMIRNKKEALA